MQTKNYFKQLLKKYSNGTIAAGERQELFELLDNEDRETEWKEVFAEMSQESTHDFTYFEAEWEPVIQKVLETTKEDRKSERPALVRRMILWKRIAAAAAVLLLVSVTSYLILKQKDKASIAQTENKLHDIAAPRVTRAMITLGNGTTISLDSVNSGTLAVQGNMKVLKAANGEIVYSDDGEKPEAGENLKYNTLINPRGSIAVTLTLSDGSKVWLNAGSSLTYPVSFTGNQRKVEITGEAYFEVAKDAAKKFIVSANGTTTEVLGTHFNVNAYDDEMAMKVTLMEGSVKVNKAAASATIKPGEQAIAVQEDQQLSIRSNVDLEEVMAWKNGKFLFGEKADISTIMRQLARWYDLEIEYKGNVTKHFGGGVSRDVNISQVLKMLETTGGVRFKINGKKVTVMP